MSEIQPSEYEEMHNVGSVERFHEIEFHRVGEAQSMPGTNGGFTMCTFKGEDVPEGTPIYVKHDPINGESDVQHCYWIMMRECEQKAMNDRDATLMIWVECFYRLWNRMTGSNLAPQWKTP